MKNKGLIFSVFLLITLGWIVLMRSMTYPLNQSSILAFEFIKTAAQAKILLNQLKALGHIELMTLSIYLDFILALLYGATFFYGSAWACNRLSTTHLLNRFNILSNMILLAVCCDIVENILLLKLIDSGPNEYFTQAAFLFAGTKFFLLTLLISHFIVSVVISIFGKITPTEN